MKRTIGIILVIVGICAGVYALTRHNEEKTLVEIGDLEIKQGDKNPGENTMIYYIIAAVGIIGGGFMLVSKNRGV